MSGAQKGQRRTGGQRPSYRHPVEAAQFEKTLREVEERREAEGKGTPMNIIRRPVELPPMVPIKDAGE